MAELSMLRWSAMNYSSRPGFTSICTMFIAVIGSSSVSKSTPRRHPSRSRGRWGRDSFASVGAIPYGPADF